MLRMEGSILKAILAVRKDQITSKNAATFGIASAKGPFWWSDRQLHDENQYVSLTMN